MKNLLAILALVLLAGTAKADSTWNYKGNLMDGSAFNSIGAGADCNCALTGTVVLSGLTPISWSFTDGQPESPRWYYFFIDPAIARATNAAKLPPIPKKPPVRSAATNSDSR
jgi:hypothetical protein